MCALSILNLCIALFSVLHFLVHIFNCMVVFFLNAHSDTTELLTALLYYYNNDVPCNKVIRLIRPCRCAAWCCFCCLQEVEVQSPPGNTIGWIKQDCTFIFPWFSIQDADGNTILKIKGPFCQCKCWDINFQVSYLHMY